MSTPCTVLSLLLLVVVGWGDVLMHSAVAVEPEEDPERPFLFSITPMSVSDKEKRKYFMVAESQVSAAEAPCFACKYA